MVGYTVLRKLLPDLTSRRHVLVVEDEEHLAIGIKYNLEAEGYRVTVVADGREALRIVEANPKGVDLIILDLMLPGLSGYDVCETLRSAGNDIPILILSARTHPSDRTRGFDVGANQYLSKPFELDELLSRVKNLLTRHGRRGEADSSTPRVHCFSFGEATINFDTYEVAVRGRPVRLTQLDMKLLEYFVAHEGRVIPRQELLEKVWGMPGSLNTRAPDQFIRRLRKHFEIDPARPQYFLTIRDAGYRFVASPPTSR
jgi:two-component system OmpR family response regulator